MARLVRLIPLSGCLRDKFEEKLDYQIIEELLNQDNLLEIKGPL